MALALRPIAHSRFRAASVSAVVGLIACLLTHPDPMAAQVPSPIPGRPASTTASSFQVLRPAFHDFVEQHGGRRVLGAPISNEFQLLGRRTQIFEQRVLQLRADGSVTVLSVIDDLLPLIHADGATYPAADPSLVETNPGVDADAYVEQALAILSGGLQDWPIADEWSGLPVRFRAFYAGTVFCEDLPPARSCTDEALARLSLDIWGLPTSEPAFDPRTPDLVYQRFQRGIMQFSQSTERVQSVPIGSWLKRVLIGSDVPADLQADVGALRLYAQYAPTAPLGLTRPVELPGTSLTSAFGLAEPTPTATIDRLASMPAPGGSFVTSAGPGSSAIQGAPLTPTPEPSPHAIQGPDPCAGDEQLLFAPMKPYAGTEVLIAATSARRHDVRSVRLSGPIKTGAVNERQGLNGWVWEWTIVPPMDGWYEFSFFADGARRCATSGFNALPPFGASATVSVATPLPVATVAPFATPTASPTATPLATPTITSLVPDSGGCNQLVMLMGDGFGYPQSLVNGQVFVVGASGVKAAAVLGWGNAQVTLSIPSSGLSAGVYSIVLQANGMASNPKTYTLSTGCS
jgi:hypothetical protein